MIPDTLHSITTHTADGARSLANRTSASARAGLLGITDRALDMIGLTRKPGPLGALLLVGVGLLVGGLAVALLTPTSGSDLRRRIRGLFARSVDRAPKAEVRLVSDAPAHVEDLPRATKATIAEATGANGSSG